MILISNTNSSSINKIKLAVIIQFISYVLCRLKVHELVTDVSLGYDHVNFNNPLYEHS